MDRTKLATNLMLLSSALLWGSSFSVRKMAADYMTPFFFNSVRLYTGFLFVLLVYFVVSRFSSGRSGLQEPQIPEGPSVLLPLSRQVGGGILCGTAFALGSICQQWGLYLTTASKTGFITTLYTIFVPLISWLILRKRIGRQIWIGAVLAVAGLFFISAGSGFRLSIGDTVVFTGAIFFALQILLTSHYVQNASVMLLNAVQLATAATVSLAVSLVFERGNSLGAMLDATGIILYTGVVCVGIAYTLQVFALKKAAASVAAIILSFESVFGAIFGAILLHERLSGFQLLGCSLIFAAIIIAQYEKREKTIDPVG